MKKQFFIYSLPRSGSAWLSMFLSQPGAFCFHEPLANGEPLEDQIARRPEEVVGAIDTSAYADPFRPAKDVPCYVLWRDWQDVEQSSLKMGFDLDVRREQKILEHHVEMTAGNKIRYKDLGNLDYLEVLWKELVGTPFDHERAEYLVEMRIERSVESIYKRLRKWRSNI